MKTYTITLTEKERAGILHCIARVEAICSINYESLADKKERKKYKEDSKFLVALWNKIKNTEPTK